MKVTFCSYDKPGNVGGPFSWICQLLPALRDHGIESRCLFLTHFGGTGPCVELLRAQGFDCPTVDCHPRMVDQVRWVLERLSESPPDVFVPNFVVAGLHAGRWVRSAGIATVGILHSDDPYYAAIQDEFICGPSASRLSTVVCVSKEIESQVRRRNPLNTSVHRISYGVNIPTTVVKPVSERFRIAYVGRLAEEQKRISEVALAFCRVAQLDDRIECVIYGDGPDRSTVDRLISASDRTGRVRLGGLIPNTDIQSVLLSCDVMALLSDYEGLPIAVLEAMACGCVPVCLDMRSGIPELVRDRVNGIVVKDRGADFSRAVQQLYSDLGLRVSLARAARQTIEQQYSHDSAARQWAHLLRIAGADLQCRHLRVPRRICLERRNPALESSSLREKPPSSVKLAFRRARMIAGRVRRRLL